MSDLNIRSLLSKTVTAIKEKLSIDSFTWGEFEDKLAEAMSGGGSVDLSEFFANYVGSDDVAKMAKQAFRIRDYAFYACGELTVADFPEATSIGEYAFYAYSYWEESGDDSLEVFVSALKEVNFPKATRIKSCCFYGCVSLKSVVFPAVTEIERMAFNECASLEIADFSALEKLGGSVFYRCSALKALILRNEAQACAIDASHVSGTPIEEKTGYIYVPSSLLSSYEATAKGTIIEGQFRALEDYTVDGTTTGELDSSKI